MSEQEALEVLRQIDAGREAVWRTDEGYNIYPEYQTASGWRFRLFDDCGSLDYVDAYSPPGSTEWIEAGEREGGVLWYKTNPERWIWCVGGTSPAGYIC